MHARYIALYRQETQNEWGATLYARGILRMTFIPEELAYLRARVAQPTAEAYMLQMAELGIPERELYDLVTATLNE